MFIEDEFGAVMPQIVRHTDGCDPYDPSQFWEKKYDDEDRSNLIDYVNSFLELITFDSSGNQIKVADDLRFDYIKDRRFISSLWSGSNLDLFKWKGEVVHRHDGSDYPLRLEFNDEGFLLYYSAKVTLFRKEGGSWNPTTLEYPDFIKFFSFPDQKTAESYGSPAYNEIVREKNIGSAPPSIPDYSSPREYFCDDLRVIKTPMDVAESIYPLFFCLPDDEIHRRHVLHEPYETSFFDYDVDCYPFGNFKYCFLTSNETNGIKISDKMCLLGKEDQKLRELEVDRDNQILTINHDMVPVDIDYSDLDLTGSDFSIIPISDKCFYLGYSPDHILYKRVAGIRERHNRRRFNNATV